jgi:glycosyltransferase involved in cell wall biosynthesis
MPKVSVIVPCYNHGKYLLKRIESILNQTFTDFELLLIDDCSTDNSWALMQNYANNPKVTLIHKNDINSGSPFIQWQLGIENAIGEYIWIAESDDYADVTFLEKNLLNFSKNKSVGVSFSPSIWVDSDDNVLELPIFENLPFVEKGETVIKENFTKGCFIYNASSALFEKSLVKNVDFEAIKTFKFTGDWLFWVQLIGQTSLARTAERLNYFRKHTENVSSVSSKNGLQFSEGIKVVNYIFDKYHISFLKKRKIFMAWALRVSVDTEFDHQLALKILPNEVTLWYKLLPILNFVYKFV